MFTIRSTRRLLDRLKALPLKNPEPPSTRLGDWYANLASRKTGELIICVSERTFLPVVLPIAALPNIAQELAKGLAIVLAELGIEKKLIELERWASRISTPVAQRLEEVISGKVRC